MFRFFQWHMWSEQICPWQLIDATWYIHSFMCIYNRLLHAFPLYVDSTLWHNVVLSEDARVDIGEGAVRIICLHTSINVASLWWCEQWCVERRFPDTHIFGIKGPMQLRVATSQDISVVPDKIREWCERWGQEVDFWIVYLCAGQNAWYQ